MGKNPKGAPNGRVICQSCRGANQEVGTPNGSKIRISMEPPQRCSKGAVLRGRVRGGVEIGKKMMMEMGSPGIPGSDEEWEGWVLCPVS